MWPPASNSKPLGLFHLLVGDPNIQASFSTLISTCSHMGVSYNGGTQQPWVFLLKMTILRCFGGTTIYGNTHMYRRPPVGRVFFFFCGGDWHLTGDVYEVQHLSMHRRCEGRGVGIWHGLVVYNNVP